MKSGLRYYFFTKLTLLCLAMQLGMHGATLAAPLSRKMQIGEKARYLARKTKKYKKAPQQLPPTTPDIEILKFSSLKKPKPLEPAKITPEDPWVRLDTLVVKQHIAQAPYVPWIQTMGVAVDYGRVAMNLFTKNASRYAGSLCILFRKNIQLSNILGYQKLTQARSMGNKSDYTVVGHYGSIGLDYFVFYNPRDNLYVGLHYGRSRFTNSITPALPTGQVISKISTASWWALNIGSEHQLFSNFGLYIGLIGHLKGLGSFETFELATNYVVPGYGRNVQNMVPSITLYIKYQISFLKKKISFN